MPAAPRFVLLVLAVEDLPRAVAFYRAAFDLRPLVEAPSYVELALGNGMRLGLYRRESFGINTGQAPARITQGAIAATEIYLYCDDLDAQIGRLEAAGARLLSPRAPRDWGDEAAYFADGDGNVLVVARPLGA